MIITTNSEEELNRRLLLRDIDILLKGVPPIIREAFPNITKEGFPATKIKENIITKNVEKSKVCTTCGEEKNIAEFYYMKTLQYYRSICKACCLKRSDIYYKNNKERLIYLSTERRKRNPEKSREYQKKSCRKRRSTPKGRIDHVMSVSVCESLKGRKKGRRWETLVGYSLKDLKVHLESLFIKEMTWENYGEWHVDHVKPKSLFNFNSYEDEEFKKCWALNNLQPLWAKDNYSKGNKII